MSELVTLTVENSGDRDRIRAGAVFPRRQTATRTVPTNRLMEVKACRNLTILEPAEHVKGGKK